MLKTIWRILFYLVHLYNYLFNFIFYDLILLVCAVHCLICFQNLLAENLALPSVEFFFITSSMKNFTFTLNTLYYLSLPFFGYYLGPFPFPTFLSTEGNTNVRETQEYPQLSACLGSNKRDLTCQHVSGNREPRCSCLLDS